MSDVKNQYQELMDVTFGNYDTDAFVTKRHPYKDADGKPYGAVIEIVHNKTKNQFVQVTPGSGSHCEYISPETAKAIMDDGNKLLWKHTKDVGTTYYDPETGEVKFWPYTGKKSGITI